MNHYTGDPGLDVLAMQLYGDWHRAGVELLGAVLADPARGVAIAEDVGVNQHTFPGDDLKRIWLAADVARDEGQGAVLRLAETVLREIHCWDDANPAGNFEISSRWSRATLFALASSYYHNEPIIRRLSRKLVDLDERELHARRLLDVLKKLLSGEFEDNATVYPKPLFVLAPMPRRGAA